MKDGPAAARVPRQPRAVRHLPRCGCAEQCGVPGCFPGLAGPRALLAGRRRVRHRRRAAIRLRGAPPRWRSTTRRRIRGTTEPMWRRLATTRRPPQAWGHVFVAGGYGSSSRTCHRHRGCACRIERYDPCAAGWVRVAPMPFSAYGGAHHVRLPPTVQSACRGRPWPERTLPHLCCGVRRSHMKVAGPSAGRARRRPAGERAALCR